MSAEWEGERKSVKEIEREKLCVRERMPMPEERERAWDHMSIEDGERTNVLEKICRREREWWQNTWERICVRE